MNRRNRCHREGFTLLEVLLAGMILAMSAATISLAISHSYQSLSHGRDSRRAAGLLDEILTKIDLIGPSRMQVEGPLEGQFPAPDERFSWRARIQSSTPGSLYEVQVTVTWTEGQKDSSASITTLIHDPPQSRSMLARWDDL